MKLPCKDCITLSVCRAKSFEYNENRALVHEKLYGQCFDYISEHNKAEKVKTLIAIRWFLRPDLYGNVPMFVHELINNFEKYKDVIDDAKQIYKENIGES